MVKVIVISGVPGVGKSTIASSLAKKLGAKVIDLSKFVVKNKLYTEYDKERNSFIIDEEKVVKKLEETIYLLKDEEYLIIEGHYGELVPKKYIYLFIVLRLNPLKLYERLKKKGWLESKIKENVASEILGIPTVNAIEMLGQDLICEIDVTDKTVSEVVSEIIDLVNNKCFRKVFMDWTELLKFEEIRDFLM